MKEILNYLKKKLYSLMVMIGDTFLDREYNLKGIVCDIDTYIHFHFFPNDSIISSQYERNFFKTKNVSTKIVLTEKRLEIFDNYLLYKSEEEGE